MSRIGRAAGLSLLLLALVGLGPAAAQTDTLYVDADATGANDGSSWTDAYNGLQDALGAATSSDEIWIAEGVYTPDPDGTDRLQSFIITGEQDGLKIYGGFASGDTFADRSPADHPVVLSGDIDGNDNNKTAAGATPTAADIEGSNSYHVFILNAGNQFGDNVTPNITSATVINGVTVTGGNADAGSPPDNLAGGLLCDGKGTDNECSPTLNRVVFAGNNASFGGAILNAGNSSGMSSPTIINTILVGNSAGFGGALYNDARNGTSSPTIINATLTDNSVDSDGGALYNDGSNGGTSSPTITNTILFGNSASLDGDEIFDDNASPSVTYSLVEDGYSGTGNLEGDPRFFNSSTPAGDDDVFATADDGLRLLYDSPLLEAGTNAPFESGGVAENVTTDLVGASRIQDETVDIGAYEGGAGPVSTYYVDADEGDDTNDGTSWSDAFATLTEALDAATGKDQIWIAEGTYKPTDASNVDDGDPDASFTINASMDGLKIYGGFDGTETSRDQRNPAEHETVLSGNLAGGDNSYHVLYFSADFTSDPQITNATVLDGVTVTGGSADGEVGSPDEEGGGLFCDGAGFEVRCSPTIRNVTFSDNRAARQGGAIYNLGIDAGESSPVIENVTFINNTADQGGAIYNDGQGISGEGESSPEIIGASFIANVANSFDNLDEPPEGGAIYNDGSEGGASSPVIINTIFTGNRAADEGANDIAQGGAIYNDGFEGTSSPAITNAAFSGNNADNEGGAMYNSHSSPTITNTILWGNSASQSGDEIFNTESTPILAYSLIQESGGSGSDWDSSLGTDGGGNLDADPQFADADGPDDSLGTADDDLRLQGPGSPGGPSPAIDAGDNEAISINEDLAGNARRQDVSEVDDTGNGSAPIVDIGAYESTGAPLPVELAGFEATLDDEAVNLTWTTASETGNARFQIQRKRAESNGSAWTTVGAVEGSGTTSQAQSYRFTDDDLPYAADALSYRLRQVDTDGSASLSKTITVERSVQELQLLGTYPNPAQQRATVRYALPKKQKASIRLYDVLGRQVRTFVSGTQEGRHERTLDVGALPSGVYFLRLRAGGEVRTQKLTIAR